MRNATAIGMVLVTAMASVLIACLPSIADAHHRPNIYCSSSGDICQSTRKVDGKRVLGLILAAKYFRVFHVCVTDPDGIEICAPFRVRERSDGTFGRDISWRRHFPNGGTGPHTVRWRVDGARVGRTLGFHVR